MKKRLSLLLTGMILLGLVSCGSTDQGTDPTTAGTTNVASTTVATTTKTTVTTTKTPVTTAAPETSEVPTKPEDAVALDWFDNNGDIAYYEIDKQDDGTVRVSYTKESYEDAAQKYGYAGYSWVNMAADMAVAFENQSTLVFKVQGTAGEKLLIKPFDDQKYEKTIVFTGEVQVIELDVSSVSAVESTYLILMGAAGATDVSGEFTIIDTYFVD